MASYLLKEIPEHLSSLAVEGVHKPGSLTQASGAWIHAAGCFVLEKGTHALNAHGVARGRAGGHCPLLG